MRFSSVTSPALAGAALVVCGACAPARPAPSPVPAPLPAPVAAAMPAPAPTPAPAPAPAPAAAARGRLPLTAPPAWHLLDLSTDSVAGVGATRALRELLNNAPPKRTITVAVIDGGVDTAHATLRSVLWLNARETPANGRDDDGNGYADDARGWNFIGGAAGNIDDDRLELTRLVATCRGNGGRSPVRESCATLEQAFTKEKAEAQQEWSSISPALGMYESSLDEIAKDVGVPKSAITDASLATLAPKSPAAQAALRTVRSFATRGLTPSVARATRKQMEGRLKFGLNPAFNGRAGIGDTPAMGRRYGNADVTGPDPSHGTAVASVIGAVAGDSGFVGVAPGIRLLPVRVVPNGDEYDKDVANGIRYAVDAGAQIINMSFGKAYSPEKAMVDSAVQYAVSKGVLLVHASGNDGEDIDSASNFPTATYAGAKAGRAGTWLEVGASDWRPTAELAASFSNYGRTNVDLFAPGVSIFSAQPGNAFAREDGTSLAAPVVSGVAALLMSQFPTLTAADVKRILMASATRFPGLMVTLPGSDGTLRPFASLSVSGGIVNAFEAVRMAQKETLRP